MVGKRTRSGSIAPGGGASAAASGPAPGRAPRTTQLRRKAGPTGAGVAPTGALPDALQAGVSDVFGQDLSDVNVHEGSQAAALGADAFASGNDVQFAPGQYDPSSASGAKLIGHELAHVVQQREGRVAGPQGHGASHGVVDDPALEAEADVMGDRLASRVDGGTERGPAPASGNAALGAAPIQRKVTVNAVPNTTVPDADVPAMKISRFVAYTRGQADWSTTYAGADVAELRQLLHDLVAEPALPDGLGEFLVRDVLAVAAADWVPLRKFCVAVNDAAGVPTAKMVATQAPTLARAIELGRAITQLEPAVGGGGVLYHITSPTSVGDLITAGRVADFVGYCTARNPQWHAPNGKEIRSFLLMPMGFYNMLAPLADVRNLHHFQFPALVRLMIDRVGGHTGQPLALILHTGLDHSGAFHHDSHLTTAIVGNPNRVIMLEGKETLAEIQNDLPTIAATYGGGQIDQVMIAGHGNSRLIELAGTTTMGTTADGRPEVQQTNDTLDLDNNEAATRQFMQILGGLMGGPTNRVVFNGCLTGSNDIVIDPASPDTPQQQITNQLGSRGSLVEAARQEMGSGSGGPQVIGANASFPEGPDLMDSRGQFDVMWTEDPALTASNKLDYVRQGIEPTGVLRAILQEWEPPSVPPRPWQDAITDRLARPENTWDGAIITAALTHIDANPADAAAISELSQSVGRVSEAYFAQLAHVGELDPVVAAHKVRLFSAVQGSSEWPGELGLPPVAFYSVWGRTDTTKYAALRAHLGAGAHTAADLEGYLDTGYLGAAGVGRLLPIADAASATRGHLVIACAAVLQGGSTVARDFLRRVATGGHFDPAHDIAGIAGSEEEVLTAIGLASGTGGGHDTERDANIDQDGDGTNESFVDRTARWGVVANCTKLRVHSGPRDAAAEIGLLDAGDRVFVQGTRGRWVSIAFRGDTGYVFERFLTFDEGTPLGT